MKEKKIKQPFNVPTGYFETLPNKVNNRISKKAKKSWLSLIVAQPYYKLAFIMLLFIGAELFWSQNMEQQEMQIELDKGLEQVSDKEIQLYLLDVDISEDELLEAMLTTDMDSKELSNLPTLHADDLEDIIEEQDLEILF